jgi:periplasmic divalent cation tolerance protein
MRAEDAIVILVTAGNEAEAERIARALVDERLVACVNVLPAVRSFYRWEGRVADDAELLLVIKTRRERFEAVAARVREIHSYDVPEVIALPVLAGSETYLAWLGSVTDA